MLLLKKQIQGPEFSSARISEQVIVIHLQGPFTPGVALGPATMFCPLSGWHSYRSCQEERSK